MKAISIYFWIILFVGINNHLYAQDYSFKVIASSGTSKNQANAGLKVGSILQANDKITVGSASFVGLSYAKGGSVQISKPGTYTIKDLETGLANSKKSVSQKYASFIIGEMTKAGDVDIHKNPYKYQNVTGSVERKTFPSAIIAVMPEKGKFYHNEYTINWHHLANNKTYIVKLQNDFDEEVDKFEVSDTTAIIKLDKAKFKDTDIIKIVITGKERKVDSEPYVLTKATTEERSSVKKQLKHQHHHTIEGLDANTKLEDAILYEENGMLIDAMIAYRQAMELDPKDEIYQIVYNQFLIRHQIGEIEKIKEADKKANGE